MIFCYLCLGRPATKEHEDFLLCKECYEDQLRHQEDTPLAELELRNPSDVCIRCGLCCVVLSAHVTDEEAAQASEEWGYPVDRLTHVEKLGPNQDKRVMTFPCVMLAGRPLQYVNCRAYAIYRPQVCHHYLCKIAIQYRLRRISLNEAIFWLRSVIQTGDTSVFNWISGDQVPGSDTKLQIASVVGDMIERLQEAGLDREAINLVVAERFTPVYEIKGQREHFLLNMIFDTYDRGDTDPVVYFTREEMALWPEGRAEFASRVIQEVLSTVRSCFDRTSEGNMAKLEALLKEEDEDVSALPDGDREVDDDGRSGSSDPAAVGRTEGPEVEGVKASWERVSLKAEGEKVPGAFRDWNEPVVPPGDTLPDRSVEDLEKEPNPYEGIAAGIARETAKDVDAELLEMTERCLRERTAERAFCLNYLDEVGTVNEEGMEVIRGILDHTGARVRFKPFRMADDLQRKDLSNYYPKGTIKALEEMLNPPDEGDEDG